ncbi:MAG: AAC(3) family N-acetyltransferase [Terriglobia bacterium]
MLVTRHSPLALGMLTKTQIREILTGKGITRGDHLLIHSSLRSVGPIDGVADALIDALLEITSTDGTVAMPAFNYTYPLPDPYFDPQTTASRAGALTEIFRRRSGTLRSLHPTHSVIAQGRRAADFLAGHDRGLTFGSDSPVGRIAQAGGYVLLIGVTHLANSTIHVGESYAGVKKFAWKDGLAPVAKMLMPDGSIVERALDSSPSCSMAFNAVEYPMRRAAMIIDLGLGDALCFLMKGMDVIQTTMKLIGERPNILFCNRKECRPCRLGREYLRTAPGFPRSRE